MARLSSFISSPYIHHPSYGYDSSSSFNETTNELDWRSFLDGSIMEDDNDILSKSFFHSRRFSSFSQSIRSTLKKSISRRRSKCGPISKTFSYIRSKMDSAMSTSSLFPTKEEVRQWESSFESLLNHKYGQMIFTQFLKKEFSSENIEFWLECHEFKKMKEGKKSTTQKAHEIYKEFVQEHSPKEVNLDSDTRAATKAAVENGCRIDSFLLAQSRIEHLMAKDSYRRFLKDKIFLDMLNESGGGISTDETEIAPASIR